MDATVTKCFACDARIKRVHMVQVENETTCVYVGSECYRHIFRAEKRGELWQPPKGGPRLGCIGSGG